MWDVINMSIPLLITAHVYNHFVLYCAVRLLFIKSVDRFDLAVIYSKRQYSSRTVFFSVRLAIMA